MKLFVVIIITLISLVTVTLGSAQPAPPVRPPVEKVETRCGWFSNPTPANASLYDSQREWIIGVQGGYQAEGDWPAFSPKQWVETNVHYGYGCACLRLTVNRDRGEVTRIVSASARPLSACRRDKALKKWDFK